MAFGNKIIGRGKGGKARKAIKKGKGLGSGFRNVTDGRQPSVRVKTAKKRTNSSARWLQRQLNDPYVAEAKRLGFRGRAAFKLIDIDDKYNILRSGQRIVDLGCAPGGWVQVAQNRIGKSGYVAGIDLLDVEPINGADIIKGDFLDNDAPDKLKKLMQGPIDVVLSDMAAATTGHNSTDHLRIVALVEVAIIFACEILKPNGVFVAKVFAGGTEANLLAILKKNFKKVSHYKPPSSRKESAEIYVVARGFNGINL